MNARYIVSISFLLMLSACYNDCPVKKTTFIPQLNNKVKSENAFNKEISLNPGTYDALSIVKAIAIDLHMDYKVFADNLDFDIDILPGCKVCDCINILGKYGLKGEARNNIFTVYKDTPYLKSYNLRDLPVVVDKKFENISDELELFIKGIDDENSKYSFLSEDMIANVFASSYVHNNIKKWFENINAIKRSQIQIETQIIEIKTKKQENTVINLKKILNLSAIGSILGGDFSGVAKLAMSFDDIISTINSFAQTRTVAKPSIIAMNMQEANISLTQEYYFAHESDDDLLDEKTIRMKIPVGIELSITPLIDTTCDEIVLNIQPSFSKIKNLNQNEMDALFISEKNPAQAVNKRKSKTLIRVKDGETIAIGGLSYEFNDSKNKMTSIINRIIKSLFPKYIQNTSNNSEFIILIRAKII